MMRVQRWLTVVLLGVFLAACGGKGAAPTPATPGAGQQTAQPAASDYFAQGNSLYQQGRYQEAEEAYRRAIELEPNNADYYSNLGVTYYTLQRMDEAIAAFRTALQHAPSDAALHYLLGAALLQVNRLDEAEQSFVRANQLDPKLGEPYYGLGVLYRLRGQRDQAIAAFERFLEIGPSPNGDPNAIAAAQEELKALREGQ